MSLPARLAGEFVACLRFYSRLPIPAFAFEVAPHAMFDFGTAIRVLPLAGLVIALPGAAVLGLCVMAGLQPAITAGLVLATQALVTGAFHEDGLADTADGLGGGTTRGRKLEIMRDSRIGSYGATALMLAILLRWAAIGALLAHGILPAMACWLVTAGVSRSLALLPLLLLEPARADGAGHAARQPHAFAFAIALALCLGLLLATVPAGIEASKAVLAMLLAAIAVLGISAAAHRLIGGQTGDIAGAAQQVAEICLLVTLGAGA